MSRRLVTATLTGLLAAAALAPGTASAASAAPGPRGSAANGPQTSTTDPCAAVEDRHEAGLCYFRLSENLEECSPQWRHAMAEVVASGAVQFFVNPLERCRPGDDSRVPSPHGNLPATS
ncbi:hypothetical protein [Streptomyces luteocolor]|uniref:hypothetical protein n=1 Tax=Streptomyces luteocolor TaxID=285500 RepID=UPI0013011A3A|nr:hypothetical protein [Streptomyces luteocolor]